MVPGNVRAQCSIARLAKRRESLREQRLADFAILPNAVSRTFVLDGTNGNHEKSSRATSDKHKAELLVRMPQSQ